MTPKTAPAKNVDALPEEVTQDRSTLETASEALSRHNSGDFKKPHAWQRAAGTIESIMERKYPGLNEDNLAAALCDAEVKVYFNDSEPDREASDAVAIKVENVPFIVRVVPNGVIIWSGEEDIAKVREMGIKIRREAVLGGEKVSS